MLAIALLPVGLLLIATAGGLIAIRAPSDGHTRKPSPSVPGSGADEPFALRPIMSLLGIVAVGLVAMFPLMLGLGKLVERFQGFDTRAWNWFVDHRVQGWYDLMGTVTQLGNSWLNRGVAVGVLLTLVVVVRQRWLTAAALIAMVFAAHYMVVWTTSIIDRPPPPGSGGTYPSGGCARVIAIYGLVAFVLLRETNAGRRTAIVAWTAIAALGFIEAYSRVYLAVHWVSDAVGGLIFGAVLLGIFIVALRTVTGRSTTTGSGPASPERLMAARPSG
jgi:membrane-associated phospholipid phosphatase